MTMDPARYLPVYTESGEPLAARVPCPRLGEQVLLNQCTRCNHGDAVVPDKRGHPLLRCFWPYPKQDPGESREALASETEGVALGAETRVVRQIMTSPVLTVEEHTDVDTVRWLLVHGNIGGLPVVDEEHRPVGIISKSDLERHELDSPRWLAMEAPPWAALQSGWHVEQRSTARAGDIMTPLALTFPANGSIARAAALMAFEEVHRLPVVEPADGTLVGLVTTLDIVHWIARESGFALPPASGDRRFR